jgi:hypothetical protein
VEVLSAEGALGLAITALLLVLGFRFARPARAREWIAVGAFALALAVTFAGSRGLAPGAVLPAGAGLRLAGAAIFVVGLLLAARAGRTRHLAALGGAVAFRARAQQALYGGLALVVVGHVARAPSDAGLIASGVGAVTCAAVAFWPERRAPR